MDLLNGLSQLETDEEKYEFLIEIGSELPKLLETQKTNENRIVGCQNRVWLHFEEINKNLIITGESDSRLVSGLIAILVDVYSGKSKVEILDLGVDFWNKNNLNLSMNRINGLKSMIKRVVEFIND